MNKKIIIGIVVLIVLIGGYMIMKNVSSAPNTVATQTNVQKTVPPVPPAQTTPPAQTQVAPTAPQPAVIQHLITYTDTGFSPKELTIKVGETVTFVNHSTKELMEAFGEHATHDEYPDKKAHPTLEVGKSDSITFPAAGTFDYHNHHAEDDEGSIIVK